MGDFPKFRHGSLLFCRNALALDCCLGDYDVDGWKDDDGSDPQDMEPCDIPNEWTGGWDIFTLCDEYENMGCSIHGPPRVAIPIGTGGCDISVAVLCEWELGSLTYTFTNPEFSTSGDMTAYIAGNAFSVSFDLVKGVTQTITLEIPEDFGSVFGGFTESSHLFYFPTRLRMMYPDGILRINDIMTYIWCEEFTGNRWPGQLSILPSGITSHLVASLNVEQPINFNLGLSVLKRGFATWEEASDVFTDYYDDLLEYAKKCRCARCAANSVDFLVEYVGAWDDDMGFYLLEAFAHDHGLEAGLETGECWWMLTDVSTTENVVCKIRNLEDGTVSEYSGSGALGPCHRICFGVNDPDDFKEGGSGVGGGAVLINPSDQCTQSIIDAYEAVPGIGLHDL